MPHDPSPNTIELLELARDGDDSAWNQLLERHRAALRRIVGARMDRRLQARVDASDIVQEAFVTAHRRMPDYLHRPAMPFFVWLRQLAKDRLIDSVREHRREKRSVEREQRMQSVPSGDRQEEAGQFTPVDPNRTPATLASQREVRRQFLEALNELEPIDQQIIRMRHLEFRSNKEVAQLLKLRPQTASMRHLRAMRRMGKHLAACGFDSNVR